MRRLSLVLALLPLAVGPSLADDDADDRDQARTLVDRAEIQPLPRVLEAIAANITGEVVDVRLKSDDRHWIYRCKLIAPDGRRVIVDIDARTLTVTESGDGD